MPDNRDKVRTIFAVLAGLLFFLAAEIGASLAARAFWPGYAEAAINRSYSLPMLIARLMVGALATIGSGWVASRISGNPRNAALSFGVALFAISLVWHINIWPEYPAWYHLVWLGCIIPGAVLGSRLSLKGAEPLAGYDRA